MKRKLTPGYDVNSGQKSLPTFGPYAKGSDQAMRNAMHADQLKRLKQYHAGKKVSEPLDYSTSEGYPVAAYPKAER
jgi:hypothetical protein